MKKIIILIILFCFYSTTRAISFRPAEIRDVDSICKLHCQFTADDYKRLVVYPQEIRRNKVINLIDNNRLFVACNNENIIGFIKLFVIENMQEKINILVEELALANKPYSNGRCIVGSSDLLDYARQLIFSGSGLNEETCLKLANGTNECLYIYYGGAYTIPEYRNSCVNSQLISFALDKILSTYLSIHKLNDSLKYAAFVYGQIEENQHKHGMIRRFALKIICDLVLDKINVFHFCCVALKPNLKFNSLTQHVEISDYEPGFGNMAVIKLLGTN
jgi:hypothetical protein